MSVVVEKMPKLRDILAKAHERMVVLSVVLAAISCTICGVIVIHDYEKKNLTLTANSISYTIEPALVFGDLESVNSGIQSVGQSGSVSRIQLVGPEGQSIKEWQSKQSGLLLKFEEFGNSLFWQVPIKKEIFGQDGKLLADVLVFGSSSTLLVYISLGFVFTFVCLGLAILTTRMLARRLESEVVAPLEYISEVAHIVSRDRTFSSRVPASGIKEVDDLSQDFNALLTELEGWHNVILTEKKELTERATLDSLTGLGNRSFFEECINNSFIHCRKNQEKCAVIFFDANDFKLINDELGHDAGDEVLRILAERLSSSMVTNSRAFRLGGDEFALLLDGTVDETAIYRAMDRIARALSTGAKLSSGKWVPLSMSMGAAIFPDDGETPTLLLKHADEQMYKQKRSRREFNERGLLHA